MQIKPNIYNVGVNGNNAYLIIGEKAALIDTVSEVDAEKLIKNIEKIMPVRDIDYLICNHTEQNKSGAVKTILEKNPDIEIIATVAGLRNLKEMLNHSYNEHVAKDNAVLDLGNGFKLKFLITPNINWPDSMVTYEESNKILFSCDLFSRYFFKEDEMEDLRDYYDEHLSSFAEYIQAAIDKISYYETDMICSGRGSIYGVTDIQEVLKAYLEWCTLKKKCKSVMILYASQYGVTKEMMVTIKDTIENEGMSVIEVRAESDDWKQLSDICNADALIVGTPTINRNANEFVLSAVTFIDAVKTRHKPFFTFGSYGWSGEGPQIVHNLLKSYGMKPFSKPFMSIFNMSDEKRAELIQHTQKFARFISEEN